MGTESASQVLAPQYALLSLLLTIRWSLRTFFLLWNAYFYTWHLWCFGSTAKSVCKPMSVRGLHSFSKILPIYSLCQTDIACSFEVWRAWTINRVHQASLFGSFALFALASSELPKHSFYFPVFLKSRRDNNRLCCSTAHANSFEPTGSRTDT